MWNRCVCIYMYVCVHTRTSVCKIKEAIKIEVKSFRIKENNMLMKKSQ